MTVEDHEDNAPMGESGTGRRQRSPDEDKRRAEAAKSFLLSVVCVLSYLLGVNKLGGARPS